MYPRLLRGMSFMDVIVGTALMLVIFTALTGLLRSSLIVTEVTKTRAIATSIAESQMEYVRSLSYDSLGTVGGIPAGNIPQISTTTQNGIAFPVRTLIEYADDPADGVGAADSNGITTDYKRIKVSVTYTVNGRTLTVDIISNYAPPSLETLTGGGTLKVLVVNATGAGVPGATVHIVNDSTAPAIDLTTFSDAMGTVFLPGAPTSTQYQIFISKSGYSSAQTYVRDTTNQNPNPGYLTVVNNQTTTGTFAIDLLATLAVRTYLPIATSTFADTFTSSASVANLTNTVVSGGAIQLANTSGIYELSGSAGSSVVSPTQLAGWGVATATTSLPAGTALRFHVVDASNNLLPDTVLPGNASGFTNSVDLYGVSINTYPSLALRADLSTSDTTVTPQLQDWSLSYTRGPIPLPNIPFTLSGAKTIGSTGGGAPIYKTSVSASTDATGANDLQLEWDVYSFDLPGYDVVQACTPPPYAMSPGSTVPASLMIASSTTNMVLVSVNDNTGAPLSEASVTVSKTGYSKTVTTDSCGNAYFGALTNASYTITTSKTGYTTFNATNVSISGHVFYPVSMD